MSLAHGEQRPCEACGARIIGARQAPEVDGPVAPIVLRPTVGGNILLWRHSGSGLPFYAIIGDAAAREYLTGLGVPLRLNHFSDCPERDRFKGGSRE